MLVDTSGGFHAPASDSHPAVVEMTASRAGLGRLDPLTDGETKLWLSNGPDFRNSSVRTSKIQMSGSSKDVKIRAGSDWQLS